MFLDDGLGENSRKELASMDAIAVRGDQTWLGYVLNMSENRLYVTEARVSKLRESISFVLAHPTKVTARRLAEVTGRIISMSKATGSAQFICIPGTCTLL